MALSGSRLAGGALLAAALSGTAAASEDTHTHTLVLPPPGSCWLGMLLGVSLLLLDASMCFWGPVVRCVELMAVINDCSSHNLLDQFVCDEHYSLFVGSSMRSLHGMQDRCLTASNSLTGLCGCTLGICGDGGAECRDGEGRGGRAYQLRGGG